MPKHSKDSKAQRPRGYVQLVVRNALLEQRLRHQGERCADAQQTARQQAEWRLAAEHLITGLQGELRVSEEERARLERLAKEAAPTVSGWKVDLDQALAANAVLTARVADLEAQLRQAAGPAPLVPSPADVRAGLYRRVSAATGPADLPVAAVQAPLWERKKAS